MSLLPSPEEFQERYDDDDELAAELPDRPITSVRDLQYVYGRLYTLATAGGGEYAAYLTPEKSTDLFDEPESLVYLRVDLSGDVPRLDGDRPVEVKTYSADLVEAVAHCWFNAARGFDHSITHRTGRDKEPEKVGEYLYERLSYWAADEVIQSAAADHEDGWVIEALAELGDRDGIEQRIVEAVEAEIEGTTTALTTVAVKLEPDGEYRLPGVCGSDVFNEAMRARKRSKLVSKGEATDSVGEATDLVTGVRTRTVGTAEDPLNYFLGKQLEKFPGFDPDEAWRTHPVSEDVAVTLMNAQSFVDACTYHTMGADVYYLPYFFGRLTPDDARRLYRTLYGATDAGDLTPVEQIYETYSDAARPQAAEIGRRLRFYVAAVMKHQTKRFDVFGDTLDGSLHHPIELTRAHVDVVESWAFNPDASGPHPNARPAFPTHEKWGLLQPDEHHLLSVLVTGWYFEQTFATADDDQAASADDYRVRALVAALSGEPLDAEELLAQYVDRLLEDEGEEFPTFRIASQFAQLCALAEAGLLDADAEHESLTESPTYPTNTMTRTPTRADGGSAAQTRETKLAQFLEQTPALSEGNPERRGSFLLGALVGQVTGYQQVSEGRSTTLVDQYPIKAVTEAKLKRLASDVLDKDVVYSRERSLPSTMYREVVDRLVRTLPRVDQDDEWELDTTDLRFYYALGVAYGMNNWTNSDDADTEEPQ